MFFLLKVVAIAKNTEGEVLASCMLDVFQKKDFRHIQLKPTIFKTPDELQAREVTWQKVYCKTDFGYCYL